MSQKAKIVLAGGVFITVLGIAHLWYIPTEGIDAHLLI